MQAEASVVLSGAVTNYPVRGWRPLFCAAPRPDGSRADFFPRETRAALLSLQQNKITKAELSWGRKETVMHWLWAALILLSGIGTAAADIRVEVSRYSNGELTISGPP